MNIGDRVKLSERGIAANSFLGGIPREESEAERGTVMALDPQPGIVWVLFDGDPEQKRRLNREVNLEVLADGQS